MPSGTYLSDLSEAQCLLRPGTHEARAAAVKNTLAANLLFFDRVYIGATDLLCNTLLHRHVFSDRDVLHGLLASSDSRGPLMQVVAWDQSPFEVIAERLLSDATMTTAKPALRMRAAQLDRFDIPKTQPAEVRHFRDHYAERLWTGLEYLASQKPAERLGGLSADTLRSARRLANDLAKLRADETMQGHISQTAVWRLLNKKRFDPHHRRTLKRLSDLAYQATMSYGVDAALSLTDRRDESFVQGALLPEFIRSAHDKSRHLDADAVKEFNIGVSSSFPVETVQNLSLHQILKLRELAPFPDIRKRLSALAEGRDSSLSGLETTLHECVEPIVELTAKNRAHSMHSWRRIQSENRNHLWFGTKEVAYVSASAALTAYLSSQSIAAGIGAFFAFAVVRYQARRPRIINENVFRTARAVAEVTGMNTPRSFK